MIDPAPVCPKCAAPRHAGPECPRCGVVFSKLGTRAHHESSELPATAASPAVFDATLDDAPHERTLRLWALPVTLVLMMVVTSSDLLRSLLRIFMSMWVHELGHAVAAWMSGFSAFPGPWMTVIAEERSLGPALFVTAVIGFVAYQGWRKRSVLLAAVAITALVAQGICTFGLRLDKAQAFGTFMGDGGCFILGALLMSSFYVGPDHPLRRRQVRWGLLVIGAAAYVDTLRTWWAARTDEDAIPFGSQERAGLSDPSRLVEWYGWSTTQLVHAYLALAFTCALLLLARAVWAVRADAE